MYYLLPYWTCSYILLFVCLFVCLSGSVSAVHIRIRTPIVWKLIFTCYLSFCRPLYVVLYQFHRRTNLASGLIYDTTCFRHVAHERQRRLLIYKAWIPCSDSMMPLGGVLSAHLSLTAGSRLTFAHWRHVSGHFELMELYREYTSTQWGAALCCTIYGYPCYLLCSLTAIGQNENHYSV